MLGACGIHRAGGLIRKDTFLALLVPPRVNQALAQALLQINNGDPG